MEIDWNAINPLRGSKENAFEELCAQLARASTPPDARFVRNGTPDGGVECYCIHPDGGEWGWQAKYFTDSPGNSQWQQLDDSVKRTLDKYPKLVRYIICLPVDLPDARRSDQTSARQRWYEHVQKWQNWANAQGREIEFVMWGSSELLELLSHAEHAGRVYFWFGSKVLDQGWFEDRVEESIRSAGPRYTPAVHVELPIVRNLEMFARKRSSLDEVKAYAVVIRNAVRDVRYTMGLDDTPQDVDYDELLQSVVAILDGFAALDLVPEGNLPIHKITELIEEASSRANSFQNTLNDLILQPERQPETSERERYRTTESSYSISRLRRSLYSASSALKKADELANSRLMILEGKGGIGKTHLLCGFASRRVDEGAPTILLMGQRFRSPEDPWTQILQHLDLPGITAEQFVGALETAAQAANCRALMVIDAINETPDRQIWPTHLPAFLVRLEQSPWIGVVLSVRSSYKEIAIPDGVLESAVAVTHDGFLHLEYDALKSFATHYGIEFPSTPVLDPEFSNPLFLKTVCEGLQSRGERRFPKGFRGLSSVFDLYLEAINNRLANSLDYDPRDNLVHRALLRVAAEMAEKGVRWLTRQSAQELVNDLLPSHSFSDSLYQALVVESILIEDRDWESGQQVVLIAYDRFTDYIIVNHLLQTHLDKENPEVAFLEGGGLAFLQRMDRSLVPGIIEALSVLIPERTGRELIRVAPKLAGNPYIGEAFLQSIVWRSLEAFSDDTRAVLNELIQTKLHWRDPLDTILSVSIIPEHPFNASFLHQRLLKDSMPERDSWWSIYLHNAWETKGPIDPLVDWALGVSAEDDIEETVVDLAAATLAWMLTTSNRYLRDRATKALVSLLTGRFASTESLVDKFADLDDPYVVERIYAVAYGVAMRSHDSDGIGKLASLVYQKVFASPTPPAHVLLRDYARGVIERAIFLEAEIEVDEESIRPTYHTIWPDIPDEKLIEELIPEWDGGAGAYGDPEWSRHAIRSSVMALDFARYVIGINFSPFSSKWLSLRLDDDQWQSPDERLEVLLAKFSTSEWQSWEAFKKVESEHSSRILTKLRAMNFASDDNDQSSDSDEEVTVRDDEALETARQNLMSELTAEHQKELAEILSDKSDAGKRDGPRFDLRLVQRYVLSRVFDMGWTVDRFGEFDWSVSRLDRGRTANKPERIGKKYQWIAYYELLAFLSDNYQYRPPYWRSSAPGGFQGPWQELVRDIDPSCILRSTAGGTSWGPHSPSWWGPLEYTAWGEDDSHEAWVAIEEGLPNVAEVLRVFRPSDSTSWLNAQGFFIWRQPHPSQIEPTDVDRRELAIGFTGYLVRAGDVQSFMEWAESTADFDRGLPDPSSISVLDSFLGEYGWAPAFVYQYDIDDADDGPSHGSGWPHFIRSVATEYRNEVGGFDCFFRRELRYPFATSRPRKTS